MTDSTTDHDLLVRLDENVASISECLKGMDVWQKSIDTRLRAVELQSGLNAGGISTLQTEMSSFKSKSNWIDIVIGFGAVVGTIVGSIFGTKSP